jgi:hypothetical protein
MPLQIRRGTTAQISGITPLTGELIYDTQLKKIIVGDGTTAGGISATAGVSVDEAKDAAAASLLAGTHDGISFFYDNSAKELSVSLNISSDLNLNNFNIINGNLNGDLKGSVFADDSSKIIDGTNGTITSPSVTISNLLLLPGGTLVNSAGNIRKTTPGPISIAPSSFVAFGSAGENISGNIFITRSNYSTSSNEGFTFAQHHNTADAVDFRFLRTRGTALSQTAVTINDTIADIVFLGLPPNSINPGQGARLSVIVDGDPVPTQIIDGNPVIGQIPVKFQFNTSDGVSVAPRAELSSTGVWKVDQIEGLNITLTVNGNLNGDLKGSVFADDSSKIIDGTDGRITSPSVTISSFLQLPVYDNDTVRDAFIPFPNKGMVIMVENRDDSTEDSTVLNKLQFYNGTNWVDL